jgi:hypothetical protein
LDQPVSVDTLPYPAVTFLEPFYRYKQFEDLMFFFARVHNESKDRVNEYLNENNLVETYFTQIVICAYTAYMYEYHVEGYENAFVPTLLNFSYAHRFDTQVGLWNSRFETVFAKRLTSQGFGYSFNILDVVEILNIDE